MGEMNTPPGALTRVGMYRANESSFKEGHGPMGGRPKGSRNKVQVDLAQLIVQAATNSGFVTIDKEGKPLRGRVGRWAISNGLP
jgi:hypothetical protein